MKSRYVGLLTAAIGICMATHAWAHCEIPCGIYDDHMRIHMIEEHITTIEKSMQQIVVLVSAVSFSRHEDRSEIDLY